MSSAILWTILVLIVLVIAVVVVARFYERATRETGLVRTGVGGRRVVHRLPRQGLPGQPFVAAGAGAQLLHRARLPQLRGRTGGGLLRLPQRPAALSPEPWLRPARRGAPVRPPHANTGHGVSALPRWVIPHHPLRE